MRKVTWIERPEVYLRGTRCYGVAHHETFTIEIDPGFHRSERQILETEVHELYHLLHPHHTEKQATRAGKFLCAELWRRGYRKAK
jgi:hypothetical protein